MKINWRLIERILKQLWLVSCLKYLFCFQDIDVLLLWKLATWLTQLKRLNTDSIISLELLAWYSLNLVQEMQIKWQFKWNLRFGCHGNLFGSQSFSPYKQISQFETLKNGTEGLGWSRRSSYSVKRLFGRFLGVDDS